MIRSWLNLNTFDSAKYKLTWQFPKWILLFSMSIAYALDSTCFESLLDFSFIHLILDLFFRFSFVCHPFLLCLVSYLSLLVIIWVCLLNLSIDVVPFFHLSFYCFYEFFFLSRSLICTWFCVGSCILTIFAAFVGEASSWRRVSESIVRVHCRENCSVSWDLGASKWKKHLRDICFGGWTERDIA